MPDAIKNALPLVLTIPDLSQSSKESTPPDLAGKYVSTFTDLTGDTLIFVGDRDEDTVRLYCDAIGWREPFVLTREQLYPNMGFLDDASKTWLIACWAAFSDLHAMSTKSLYTQGAKKFEKTIRTAYNAKE